MLDRVSFAPGYGYAEGAVGTTGVGTGLESGRSVHVVGAYRQKCDEEAAACYPAFRTT